jgi:acyl-CoA thioesterase-1
MPLPTVYLLGDSISAGYAPFVEAALAGLCAVRLRPENGKDSRNLLARAPGWLGAERYAAIHVNCGLHDIKRAHGDPRLSVPLDEYEANLRQLVPLLRQWTGALIWARTTPVRDGQSVTSKSFDRLNRDVDAYNLVADRVMTGLRVPVNNLHGAVVNAGLDACLSPDGVHMTEFGYTVLAARVADALRPYLRSLN